MQYALRNGIGHRVDDEHRGYRPPVKPEPFTAPLVKAPAATTEGSTAQRSYQAMLHAQMEFQRHIEATTQDRDKYSDSGYQEQIQAFTDTDVAKNVDQALADVQDRRAAAQTKLDQVHAGLTPNGDVAAELRATRLWQRTKSILDNADEGTSVARKLIAQADREELGTLLQELPAFFEARGLPTEWIYAVAADAVPEYGRASAELDRADQALAIANWNAASLKDSFTDEHSRTVLAAPDDHSDPDST